MKSTSRWRYGLFPVNLGRQKYSPGRRVHLKTAYTFVPEFCSLEESTWAFMRFWWVCTPLPPPSIPPPTESCSFSSVFSFWMLARACVCSLGLLPSHHVADLQPGLCCCFSASFPHTTPQSPAPGDSERLPCPGVFPLDANELYSSLLLSAFKLFY